MRKNKNRNKKKKPCKKPEAPKAWYSVWGHSPDAKTVKLAYSTNNAFCLERLVVAQESGKYDTVTLEPDNAPRPVDHTPGYSDYNRND